MPKLPSADEIARNTVKPIRVRNTPENPYLRGAGQLTLLESGGRSGTSSFSGAMGKPLLPGENDSPKMRGGVSSPLMNTPNIEPRNTPFNPGVGEAFSELGQLLNNVAVNVSRIDARNQRLITTQKNQIDTLRVEDAYNQLRNTQLDLTAGEKGYLNLKGAQAIDRKTPVLDEYSQLFDAAVNKISGTLSSDAQRTMLKQRTDSAKVNFRSGVLQHVMGEAEKFNEEAFVGAMSTEERAAMVDWANPAAIDKSKMRIMAVAQTAFAGKPPEFINAKVLDSFQRINSAVVAQAVSSGNIPFAENYMQMNNDQMDVSDLIKYSHAIFVSKEGRMVDSAIHRATYGLEQRYEPNDFDRLEALVIKQESGGNDYDKFGNLLRSPKGAMGRYQVMPETAKAPGNGIFPARDNSTEELARVGRSLLQTDLKIFGNDVAKGIAAYNAGAGAVNAAVKAAEDYNGKPSVIRGETGNRVWIDFLPQETQNYVSSIMSQYTKGVNPINPPTITEIKKTIRANLPGVSEDAISRAEAKAEAIFNDVKSSVNQKSEQMLLGAKNRFDAGEITGLGDLSPSERVILGEHNSALRSYIDAAGKREQDLMELSPAATTVYHALYTDSKKLMSMSVPEIMKLGDEIGISRARALLNRRDTFIEKPDIERAASIDDDQLKAVAVKFGYEPNPTRTEDRKRNILLKDRAAELIIDEQTRRDKLLTRSEKEEVLKRMFTEIPDVKVGERGPGLTRWMFGKEIIDKALGYELKSMDQIVVPDELRGQIITSLKKFNVPIDDNTIKDTYLQFLMKSQIKD